MPVGPLPMGSMPVGALPLGSLQQNSGGPPITPESQHPPPSGFNHVQPNSQGMHQYKFSSQINFHLQLIIFKNCIKLILLTKYFFFSRN